MRIRSLLLPGLAVIVVGALALSLSHHTSTASSATPTPAASTAARRVTVPISMYAFKPQALTVNVGTRVTWTNHDNTAHTATADDGRFDTGTINPGQSRTIDFKRPGTYTYHCAFHAFMTATIKVVG